MFSESKYLSEASLSELRKVSGHTHHTHWITTLYTRVSSYPPQALIFGSHGPDIHQTLGTGFDEDSAIFYLELLVTVTLENRYTHTVT